MRRHVRPRLGARIPVTPSQLEQLATRFPDRFVHTNPSGGGQYVSHDAVVQRLLYVVGPFDFTLVEILRGDVPAIAANPQGTSRRAKEGAPALTSVIVGAVCRLSVVVDGRRVQTEEVGDCEQPHNWPHDGARMKDAMSDAIKRCAMRLGLGLHLWAQDEYVLDKWLASDRKAEEADSDDDDAAAKTRLQEARAALDSKAAS